MVSGSNNFGESWPEPSIFAIHGVGNPVLGETASWIQTNLSEIGFTDTVREINWNRLTDQPLSRKGNIQLGSVATLARVIANASFTYPSSLKGNGESWLLNVVFLLEQVVFLIADCSIAIAFWSILIFFPIAFLAVIAASAYVPATETLTFAYLFIHFIAPTCVLAIRVAFFSIVSFLFLAVLQAWKLYNWKPIFVGFRRSLALILRPILFLITCPLFLPWRSFAKTAWKSRLGLGTGMLVTTGCYAAVLHFVFLSQYRDVLKAGLGNVITRSIEACLVMVSAAALVYVVGPGLKILADIFRYAGDSAYRERILELTAAEIAKARTNNAKRGDFYLITHSLGSVIAVDVLLNSGTFTSTDRITLITMGSPLRRFFFRFFPELFFPDSAVKCADLLASRFSGFRWINCYRPLDPIGTRLDLPIESWTSEISTAQFGRVWNAHPGYWTDSNVRDCVLKKCTTVTFVRAANSTYSLQDSEHELIPREKIMKLLWRLLIGVIALVPLYGFYIGAVQHSRDAKAREINLLKLQSDGIDTVADVTYERQVAAQDETGPLTYQGVITVVFRDLNGVRHTVCLQELEGTRSAYDPSETVLDVDALARIASKEGRQPPNHKPGLEIEGVRIRYLPSDPSFIYVTQFPPHHNATFLLFTWILIIVFLPFVTYWLAIGTYYIGGIIGELFVGQALSSAVFFKY